MIITKNYFTLNDTLISLLFSDEAKQIGQLYINFTTPKMNNGKYFILNYYNFNILLKQTKDQNTIYHTINDDFFQKLKFFICNIKLYIKEIDLNSIKYYYYDDQSRKENTHKIKENRCDKVVSTF